jgi:hypothetical protein
MDTAVPGVQYVPPVGKGQGQPLIQGQGQPLIPQNAHGIVDAGNWPNAPVYPGTGRPSAPISMEQREAKGPLWFHNTGACVRKSCNKAHRVMTAEERLAIPTG